MVYDKFKIIIIYGIGGAVILGLFWLMLKLALPIFLPFIIAYAIAYILKLGAKKLSNVTGMDEKILRILILTAFVAAIALILWFGSSAVLGKLSASLSSLSQSISAQGGITETLQSFAKKLGERFGGEEIAKAFEDFVLDSVSKASGILADIAVSFISSLPSFAIGCAVSIVSLFYFTFGYEKAADAVKTLMPEMHRRKICVYINRAMRGLVKFLRIYSLIILVTFSELFIGFLILKVEHAFILAAIISIVDFFPVLGVGGVLVPWAVVSFTMGNVYTAVGLFILLAVIWTVRQPVEARLIGKGAGVHPIFALMAVYAGFRLAGVFGMIAAPILLTAITVVLKEKDDKKSPIR